MSEPAVYVCSSPPETMKIKMMRCPTCKCKRRFLFTVYEWYSPTFGCLTCGDKWTPEERMPRPFAPKWRQESVRQMKIRYAAYESAKKELADGNA